MVRRPYAPDGLVDALYRLGDPLVLLTTGIAEQLGLLENFVGLHVANTDGFFAAVDVLSDDDGVLRWSWGDGELDLRVGGGELGEERFDETAEAFVSIIY